MKKSLAAGLVYVFMVAIGIVSMMTSALFFVEAFTFGRGFVDGSMVGTVLAASIGVLVTDIAALVWLFFYLRVADNNTVRAIAMVGSVAGFLGSAICSFAYLSIVAGNTDSGLPANASVWIQWALAILIILHFALVFLSQYKSTHAQIAEAQSGMVAEGTDEMLKLMETEFRKHIPALAAVNADSLVRQLAGQFASLTNHDDDSSGYTVEPGTSTALPTGTDGHTAIPAMSGDDADSGNGFPFNIGFGRTDDEAEQ